MLFINNYSNNIKLTDLIPSNDKYVYTFSIQNYKDNDICEVDMIYDVLIKTTTNLPLNYELYLNDNLLNVNKEISVAATKTYIAEVLLFYILAGNNDFDDLDW